ncbi:MAG: DUF1460 domain-containing protein [Ignavibacteria bacterium]|nr:DUF1460 domain-containing protein [Ignavibacteria bacterium]
MSKISRRKFIKSSALSAIFLSAIPQTLKSFNRPFWDDYDEILCKKKFKAFIDAGIKSEPIGDVIAEVGKSFIDTDYVAGTLDKNMSESLVIDLTGLDCVTFVENCLTFARCIKLDKTTFDDYKSELKKIRYRDGLIDGYSSRLHYFCDWIWDNEAKGIVKNITAEIGGVEYSKNINFMTTHTKAYKQLANSTELDGVKAAEEAINSRNYYFIPTNDISRLYDLMKTGDIIATTTNIKGLDVTHTGYIYKENGGTFFMHASSKSKKVIISNEELQDYVASDSKKTGIMIARPMEI